MQTEIPGWAAKRRAKQAGKNRDQN